MKIISPSLHAILDYAVVLFLWISPSLFDFSDYISTFTYVLGGIHLLLTVTTAFKGGLIKLIPLRIHGLIELLVSVALVVLPRMLAFTNDTDKAFYTGFGIAVFLTWLLTDYRPAKA
jgi:hypothetical protein